MKRARRYRLISLIAASILLSGAFTLVRQWYSALSPVERRMRCHVAYVLGAYYRSRMLTGEYWENRLEARAAQIIAYPATERLSFYLGVLLNCDMRGAEAMTFAGVVGDDATALLGHLRGLKACGMSDALASDQRRRLDTWVVALPAFCTASDPFDERDTRSSEGPMEE